MSGPIPKRSEERRRRNKDGIELVKVDIDALVREDVEIPDIPMTNVLREVVVTDDGRLVWSETWLEEPVPAWEPLTISYWESFARSGQSIFYEPTDWMTAYMLMETLDRWLKPQEVKVGQIGSASGENAGGSVAYLFEPRIVPIPGGVLNAILKGLASLMATEGDRRKLRIELERKAATDAALEGNVVDIFKSRADLFATASRG